MVASSTRLDYRSAVAFETARRGQYQNVDYNPVFRGSGIFFAFVNPVLDTEISFMNYWREKNGIEHVAALVTLRDEGGNRVARDYFAVSDFVYRISCRNLLERAGTSVETSFTGSIEVEVFSAEDLKFAVSALEVFYVGRDAVSFVHANQRTFNDFEDMRRFGGLNAWQTGFDVYADHAYVGFVAVLNGPLEVKDAAAQVMVINADGQMLERSLSLGDVPPYAARLVRMDEIDGAPEHLGGKPGMIKLDLEMSSIFNRLLSGNISRDAERLLITHSYYDCTGDSDYLDRTTLPTDEYAAFLPFVLPDALDLDLVFYPIYSPAKLAFSLELRDINGRVAGTLDDVGTFDSSDNRTLTIDVRGTLRKHGLGTHHGLFVLRIEPADPADPNIPLRLTFGMNYRDGRIGSNINASILLNPGYGVKKRTYLWGPIRFKPGSQNHLMAPYISKQVGDDEEAILRIRFWDHQGVRLDEQFTLKNGTALNVVVEDYLTGHGVAIDPDEPFMWYTLESDSPNFTAYCAHHSALGFVGADHSF